MTKYSVNMQILTITFNKWNEKDNRKGEKIVIKNALLREMGAFKFDYAHFDEVRIMRWRNFRP